MVEVSSDVIYKIIKIVKDGGGEVFEQEGYINFCGVRNNVTNDSFNDSLYIYWKDVTDGTFKCVKTDAFTTKPGKKVILNEGGKTNSKGAAIVKEGWHKNCWYIGVHNQESPQNKHLALRQEVGVTEPITITRDKSQFGNTGKYELRIFSDTTEVGYPYTNLHRAGDSQGYSVNGWSAGCQVFQYISDFDEMMELAKKADGKGQKKFSYYLTNKNIFDETIVDEENIDVLYEYNQTQYVNEDQKYTNENIPQYTNNVPNLGSSGLNESPTSIVNGNSGEYNVGASSSFSFGGETIFGVVFPKDDNNKYIEMSSDDIAVIQYTEPKIKVDKLKISEKNLATIGVMPDKISYYVPVVYINDFMIPQTYITNFCLDYSSFAPQVMLEFVDMTNELLSTSVPKPGSFIKVFIGGYGDENYYKPIRQDFVITNINKTNKTGGEYQNRPHSKNPIKYKLTGVLNVPMGFRKMSWSSSNINARQALFNVSNMIGLGFATNFNINNDVDKMRWINTQNKSLYDFMKNITQHSCYSPYTFFTSFIDQYYVLNYVECHSLLSHGGQKTDTPQIVYNCIMSEVEKNKTDIPDENLNSGSQKLSYYFLTNDERFKGWTNYIEEYYELNDGYSMVSDGYKKTLTYSDKCGFSDLMSKNYKFTITPIDNLIRDNKRNIVSLPENVNYNSYIPLNLIQTTNSAYLDNPNIYDNPTAAESTVDIGEIDTSNNFPLYFYAPVQNDFQMKNFKKCGLSVRLENYNPSITRYSRIWVDIFDMNDNSSTQIRKNYMVDDMQESIVKDYFKTKNDNIISFREDTDNDNIHQAYNRSLSGWYVVTDMKISYNNVKDFKGVVYKKLQTQLILNRIEYKPTFKDEYEMARKAIEKYKLDNVSDNIMCSGDIIQ